MRVERILAVGTALLLSAGFLVWAASGGALPRRWSIMLWSAAFAISALPLLSLGVYTIFGRSRKR
jgi:hypothetical protein